VHRVGLEEVVCAELVDDVGVELSPVLREVFGYDGFVLVLEGGHFGGRWCL
jgi:hypothetical protein